MTRPIRKDLQEIPPDPRGSAVTIGNFDGVHRGHARIMETLRAESAHPKTRSVVITFDPHPLQVLKPELGLKEITPLSEKARLLFHAGIDEVVALTFNREFAAQTAEEFFRVLLRPPLSLKTLVVGYDFHFGRHKSGGFDLIASLGKTHGVSVHMVPPFEIGGHPVSSRRIRELLRQAQAEEANTLLGHDYLLLGHLTSGRGRGKTLGFPTANLELSFPTLLPPGVYAVRAEFERQHAPGVMALGPRPTFDDHEHSVEIHLLDLPHDPSLKPGETFRVKVLAWIRENQKFPGPEALIRQIKKDIEEARKVLSHKS
ncbi:MAG: bifunctional riboflavin kinase/FAD synthetase [bacterium]|nr:bifunctional riboflavin kinase/FAD synthetase [bacterium]